MDASAIARWDTLVEIRSPASDTTLLSPIGIVAWGSGFAVADWMAHRITYFSRAGERVWSVGRKGEGPEEFLGINDLYVGSDSTLRVLDASNGRIATIGLDGNFRGTYRLNGIPPFPWGVLDLGDSILVLANDRERTIWRFNPGDPKGDVSARPFRWPSGMPDGAPRSTRGAVEPGGTRWAVALQHGPGFLIGEGGTETAHYFVEPIPFGVNGIGRSVFGATAAHGTKEAIYFLFGGRPRRIPADPEGDPPRRIDKYSWDGSFQQRYLFPNRIMDFYTDGELFYIVEAYPEPAVLVLRPSV